MKTIGLVGCGAIAREVLRAVDDGRLAVSVAGAWQFSGYVMALYLAGLRGISMDIREAAMIDGCGPWRIYWMVIVPLSLPALATAAIFTFIWTWDDFFGPLVYLNDMNSYTVQLGLRSFVDSTGKSDWGALFAMSTLTLLPVFAFFLFFQRLLIDGIATTGLKG